MELGFKKAMNAEDFMKTTIDFKKFDKVFIEKFNDDYRNLSDTADIFDLVKEFKIKAGYDPKIYLSGVKEYVYNNIAETPIKSSANVIQFINQANGGLVWSLSNSGIADKLRKDNNTLTAEVLGIGEFGKLKIELTRNFLLEDEQTQ